jgi:hypothetical protein
VSEDNLNLPSLAQIKRIPEFKPLKPKQIRFISALIKTDLKVEDAAKIAGCDWRNHYFWLKTDTYKQAYEYAREILSDLLESTMLDHAIVGREAPIIYKGEITGNYREINSSERITLLKGLKPQYRDNWQINQITGPTQLNIVHSSAVNSLINETTKDLTPKLINPSEDK